jgi:hypothetical protein
MSTYAYRQALDHIQQLTPVEQLQLMGELATILQQSVVTKPLHSVMEFKGLGKEIWQGINAQEYVNQERDAWGG